jgi:peptidoglycan/xylan/chitin deacetylase (PgdA/CDA1 family)
MALVVISLDFEMRWGVHDVYGYNFDQYRENVSNLHEVVPHALNLLAERNLRATWAAVGAIGLNGWQEYFDFAPPAPAYNNARLVVSPRYAELDADGLLHFAPNLIWKILATPGQELGSHTFSHIYFREPGVTEIDFLSEMNIVAKLWRERFKIDPVSLVFPRNQIAFEHLIPRTGIRIWRGNESSWYFNQNTEQTNSPLPRLLRLTESISPWTRRAVLPEAGVTRSSLFIRFNLPELLWRLHMVRIDAELRSLTPGQVFHIWWHPENLGIHLGRSLNRLSELLDVVASNCMRGHAVSSNMEDLSRTSEFQFKEQSNVN